MSPSYGAVSSEGKGLVDSCDINTHVSESCRKRSEPSRRENAAQGRGALQALSCFCPSRAAYEAEASSRLGRQNSPLRFPFMCTSVRVEEETLW